MPINKISSLFRLVFDMSRCYRLGCLVTMDAILIENSYDDDDRSFALKLKYLTVMFLFMASIM